MSGTPTLPDIPLFDLRLEQEDLDAVAEILRTGRLSQGPVVEAFEAAFAEELGTTHVVAVSSCTAALHLAFLAAGIGPGDEVIVPSYSFVATANGVIYCGATPVFADIVGRERPLLDPNDVERRITSRTRAVCTMHFSGYPSAVERLKALCDARGLVLIEDAAHTPSAIVNGRKLGTWGLAGAFSFFSNKVLSVGEGGALCTDSPEVAALARSRRSYAISDDGQIDGVGYNYRLDEPRAALLLSRLRRMGEEIDQRRALTLRYRDLLREVPKVIVPFEDGEVSRASCYVMPVMLEPEGCQARVMKRMRDDGVQTSILYPAIHQFSVYRERFPGICLPRTEAAAHSELTLPLYPHMSDDDVDRVVHTLRRAVADA